MIGGVHKVVLYVDDQLAAKRFWTESMGCTVAIDAEYGDERWVEVTTPDGAVSLALIPRKPGFERPDVQDDQLPHSNIFFYADDIEAAHRELVAKGVKFPTSPVKQFWGWWSVFEDNEGTRYALSQR